MPHRGQEFSVDDDPSEVEDDRSLTPTTTHFPFPPMARQGSTLRRRPTHQVPTMPRLDSQSEEEREAERAEQADRPPPAEPMPPMEEEATADDGDDEEEAVEDDDADASDAESFTLKDKQLAINETHPFGIRIWKPALYKKDRSVEKTADEDIHSSPSAIVGNWLWIFNFLWTLLFGWWLALASLFASAVCLVFAFEPSAAEYAKVFVGLAKYLFYPFGQFVRLESEDENYAEEDEGEGRSISEYERWQRGDLEYGRLMFGPSERALTGSIVGRRRESVDSASEQDSLLGRTRTHREDTGLSRSKRRLFGRGQWTIGRVIFFVFFYFLIAPLMLLVSGICWLMVFWIPMGRVTGILFYHLRRHPLALTFHTNAIHARSSNGPSSILLCTYRAVGLKYWKYTVGGTNIFLINFLAVVVFVVFDYFILGEALGLDFWLTSPALLFPMALLSVIPLAYFIGQAVASISAQSSMGMGAAVNAFFSTIVEVYLYCVALNDGKGKLVEGSIIGSIFAGVLLLPGLSMCFGAIKRKTQRFNVRSAGATSTMLLFATIAAFGPTLFYKIYGAHELICRSCDNTGDNVPRDCRQCFFRQVPASNDDFFVEAVRPYCWFAAVLLFASYIIGLLFTLRTHAAVIWATEVDEKKALPPVPTVEVSPFDTRHPSTANAANLLRAPSMHRGAIKDSELYKHILGQSLKQAGLSNPGGDGDLDYDGSAGTRPGSQMRDFASQANNKPLQEGGLPYVVPPKDNNTDNQNGPRNFTNLSGLSEQDNINLVRQVAEMTATAATVAARDVTNLGRRQTSQPKRSQDSHGGGSIKQGKPQMARVDTVVEPNTNAAAEHAVHGGNEPGGHDAPNWSRMKSYVILLTATVAYAAVAEVLVNTVDVVLKNIEIDEKFLGITLFALVPNTTEFLNAISFAMNGNIALSMEIGSAYALQVCLLQLPALVLYSAVIGRWIDPYDLIDHTFSLIFPQWDMVTVILCVFLLSYMLNEGKSNYFKGSILVMTYLVVLMGFYYSGYTSMDVLGVEFNMIVGSQPARGRTRGEL